MAKKNNEESKKPTKKSSGLKQVRRARQVKRLLMKKINRKYSAGTKHLSQAPMRYAKIVDGMSAHIGLLDMLIKNA